MNIFPTSYFGNLAYYQEIIKNSEILIEINEYFTKQTFRNRCEILTANGICSLSVPVKKVNGNKTLMKDITITDQENWRKDHWRAIESAYSSSPYFEYYESEIKELIYTNEPSLVLYNENINKRILSWIGFEIKTKYTEDFLPYIEKDFRIDLASKHKDSTSKFTEYIQTFGIEFVPNLSILDAIFNLGPMTRKLI